MQRAGALLGGAQREPRLHLALAGGAGDLGERLAVVAVVLEVGVLLGPGQPGLQVAEPGEVLVAGLLGLGDRALEPLGLAAGGAGLGAELAELLGHRGEGGVGLVQLGQRDVDALLGLVPLALEPGHVEAEPLGRRDRLGQLLGGLVDRGLDLDQAGLAGRAAGRHVGAEQVAVAGDRGQRAVAGDERPRGGQVVDDRDPVEQPRQRGAHGRRGRRRRRGRTTRRSGSAGQLLTSSSGPEPSSSPARPRSCSLRWPIAATAASALSMRDGVRRAAERVGHGGLEAGAHREQGGHRAEQPGDLVGGGEQGAGAVLAVEADLEGVLARGQAGAVALGPLGLLAGLGQPLVEVVEVGDRRLVLGVQPLLAGVEPGDPGLQGGEVVLGAAGPGQGVLAGLGEPADLVVGGGGARAQRVDLAVQPGQALAAVGGGAVQPGDPALLLRDGVLGAAPGGDRLLQRDAVLLDLGLDRVLLLAHLRGLGLQRLGVAAGRDVAGGDPLGVADPLGGQGLGAAQPLAQPGQREPGLLGLRQRGQVLAQRRLEPALGLLGRGLLGLDLLAAGDQDRLVGELLLERGARGDQVVGDQPGLGVADRRLDAGRTPGHLGLPAQRLELAADLAEQVGEPGQVAVAGVELAERLLLALAVLEDAGGLLDEAAPVLRRRVQDRVELALPDDDVHLAADAGVGQQLLDVEQPAAACR